MKLLLCDACGDIFNLRVELKTCGCGRTRGVYLEDRLHAWYAGEHAVPLGITNTSFNAALANQPQEGMGERFVAFVIPKDCPTFERKA